MVVIRTNPLINESFSPTDEMLRRIGVDPDEYHRRLSEARSMTLDDLAERLGCAPPAPVLHACSKTMGDGAR